MCVFFMRADERRYCEFHEDLKKGVFRGRNEYLETVSDAYQLLLKKSRHIGYQSNTRVTSNRVRVNMSNINFILVQYTNQPENVSPSVLINDGLIHEEIVCYVCRDTGHYTRNCPSVRGVNILQTDLSFAQNSEKL